MASRSGAGHARGIARIALAAGLIAASSCGPALAADSPSPEERRALDAIAAAPAPSVPSSAPNGVRAMLPAPEIDDRTLASADAETAQSIMRTAFPSVVARRAASAVDCPADYCNYDDWAMTRFSLRSDLAVSTFAKHHTRP